MGFSCRFFSYSLEGRIVPRHKILVENRVNFKLRYMLSSTDEEFDRRVQGAIQRRQRFESGVMDDDEAFDFQNSLEDEVDDCDESHYSSYASVSIEQNSNSSESELKGSL